MKGHSMRIALRTSSIAAAAVGAAVVLAPALSWAQTPAQPDGYLYGPHMMWGGRLIRHDFWTAVHDSGARRGNRGRWACWPLVRHAVVWGAAAAPSTAGGARRSISSESVLRAAKSTRMSSRSAAACSASERTFAVTTARSSAPADRLAPPSIAPDVKP